MKSLFLIGGQEVLVDDEDFDALNALRWHINWNAAGKNCYATRRKKVDGKWTLSLMHREIINAPLGSVTDHINGNGLDNRRCNLRICSQAENARNRRKSKKTPLFKGIQRLRSEWRAQIGHDGKTHHLGRFKTAEEAARAYDAAARILHGEFALLNFSISSSKTK